MTAIHLGFVGTAGCEPYDVPYENDGRLIRNVVPVSSDQPRSSWGYSDDFTWHTDNPNLPFADGELLVDAIPRVLAFQAIRNLEAVPTEMISVDEVLSNLGPTDVKALTSPYFRIEPPESGDPGSPRMVGAPIVEQSSSGVWWARYDRTSVDSVVKEYGQALSRFANGMSSVRPLAPVLQPGQLLLFDNYRVLHQRRAFEPASPGSTRRWLRRVYARVNGMSVGPPSLSEG